MVTLRDQKWKQILLLVVITTTSIGLITWTDDAIAYALPLSLKIIAYVRIPSATLCLVLWLTLVRPRSIYPVFGDVPWGSVVLPAILWLVPTAWLVLGHRVWVPRIVEPVDVIAFMITGLLAEEFLFRGAIYGLVCSLFENISGRVVAIGCSALFFGLSHFQYHNFEMTQAAVTQVIYTTGMGIFFGIVRERSERIWPCVLLHLANNSFTLIANLT